MTEDAIYHILRYVNLYTILPTVIEGIAGSHIQQIYRIGMYSMGIEIPHKTVVTSYSSTNKGQMEQIVQRDGHKKKQNRIKIGNGANRVTKITKITSGTVQMEQIVQRDGPKKKQNRIKIGSGTIKVTKITKITSGTVLLF